MIGLPGHSPPTRFRFAGDLRQLRQQMPFRFQTRCNFILPLDTPYPSLATKYKKDLVRNLKLAARAGLQYNSGFDDMDGALRRYRNEYGSRLPQLKIATPTGHSRIYSGYLRQHCRTDPARPPAGWVSRSPLPCWPGTGTDAILYSARSTTLYRRPSHARGGRRPTTSCSMRLVDELAGTGDILDFEGSDLPGIAHF